MRLMLLINKVAERVQEIVKSHFCGYEADISQFKFLRDPWNFRFYEVKMIECPKCHGVFTYYYITSNNQATEFTIKIRPRKGESNA